MYKTKTPLVLILVLAFSTIMIIYPAETNDTNARDTARTIVKGIQHREGVIQSIEVEFLRDIYTRVASEKPETLPGVLSIYSSGTHGLSWVRAFAEGSRVRLERTVLKPGPGGIPCGSSSNLFIRDPEGNEIAADYVRSLTIYDGSRHLRWDNVTGTVIVRPQEWSGSPVGFGPILDGLMFGFGDTFGSKLERALAGVEDVSVEEVLVEGRHEYRLVLHQKAYIKAGRIINDWEVYIVPDWGYAVRRYEEKHIISPSGWGTGDLVVGADFKEVAKGIWIPQQVVHESFEYGEDKRDPWEGTARSRVTRVEINQPLSETLFTFHPPLCTHIHDETGTIRQELIEAVSPRIGFRARQEAENSRPPLVKRHLNVVSAEG